MILQKPSSRWLNHLPRLALLGPHVVTTALALGSQSRLPLVLGRYSMSLFVFNVINCLALAAAITATVKRALRPAAAALLVLGACTFLAAMNNELAQARGSVVLLVAARSGFLVLFLLLARDEWRRAPGPGVGRMLQAGLVLLSLNTVDTAALAIFGHSRIPAAGAMPFRRPVELSRIESDAVVVVGDSFVFGEGVKDGEPFADRLGGLLAGAGEPHPVYNLGLSGTGPVEYASVLEQVPERDATVVCFYMNDMPERERPLGKLRDALMSVGRTSFALRLGADRVGLGMYPDADEYLTSLVRDFDEREPTFPARWAQLTGQLERLAKEAKRGSRRPPIFVILPIMETFATYRLTSVHERLGGVARALGFEVVDLLPVFAAEFPEGKKYRARPNDNHFNAEVHARVAEVIRDAVMRSESVPGRSARR